MYRIAWNIDEDNPNPHAWELGSYTFETEAEAFAAATAENDELLAEGYSEEAFVPYVVVREPRASNVQVLIRCGQQIAELADSLRGGEKGGDEVEHPAHDLDEACDLIDSVISRLSGKESD